MKTRVSLVLGPLLFLVAISSSWPQSSEEAAAKAAEQAGRLREALTQYTSALQKVSEGSADEQRLREAIIGVAQKLKPVPSIPDEARRFLVRGSVAIKEAKSEKDFEEAAREFGRAVRAAPWWADAYFNQGVAYERAGKHDEAIRSLKLYLLAAPRAQDSEKVKEQIYALEYRQEKARKDALAAREEQERKRREEQAKAAEEQEKFGHWLSDWRYESSIQWGSEMRIRAQGVMTVSRRGDMLEGLLRYTGTYYNNDYRPGDGEPAKATLRGVIQPATGEINWTYVYTFSSRCYKPDEWRPVRLQPSADRRAVTYSYAIFSVHHQTCAPTSQATMYVTLTR